MLGPQTSTAASFCNLFNPDPELVGPSCPLSMALGKFILHVVIVFVVVLLLIFGITPYLVRDGDGSYLRRDLDQKHSIKLQALESKL